MEEGGNVGEDEIEQAEVQKIQEAPEQAGFDFQQNRVLIPRGIEPVIQNVVSTTNFGCALDLKKIAYRARNCEYNPNRFSALMMRIREPRTTALIFSSGKIVVTGARSVHFSKLAARKFGRLLKKIGFPVKFLVLFLD